MIAHVGSLAIVIGGLDGLERQPVRRLGLARPPRQAVEGPPRVDDLDRAEEAEGDASGAESPGVEVDRAGTLALNEAVEWAVPHLRSCEGGAQGNGDKHALAVTARALETMEDCS